MKNQKFKRGNLVHIAKDLPHYQSHFESDVDVIIEYSYADMYGGSDTTSYSVIFPDDGHSVAWYKEDQLTLIDEGGEYLIEQAAENKKNVSKRNKDIEYIKKNLSGGLGSESILYLFSLIGYESRLSRTGEFFHLFDEWLFFYPIFKHILKSNSLDEAKIIPELKEDHQLDIEKMFNAFHNTTQP